MNRSQASLELIGTKCFYSTVEIATRPCPKCEDEDDENCEECGGCGEVEYYTTNAKVVESVIRGFYSDYDGRLVVLIDVEDGWDFVDSALPLESVFLTREEAEV